MKIYCTTRGPSYMLLQLRLTYQSESSQNLSFHCQNIPIRMEKHPISTTPTSPPATKQSSARFFLASDALDGNRLCRGGYSRGGLARARSGSIRWPTHLLPCCFHALSISSCKYWGNPPQVAVSSCLFPFRPNRSHPTKWELDIYTEELTQCSAEKKQHRDDASPWSQWQINNLHRIAIWK
jgi:hypothetical protein